jgi:(p)ppGpp synthase/HD superfamily hydrolase
MPVSQDNPADGPRQEDGSRARLSDTTGAQLRKARDFAVHAHGAQRYGDKPYVDHLLAVVRILEQFGASADCRVAGWLHDTIEDTSVTRDEVSVEFGDRVASLVWAVTGEGHGNRQAHSASICAKIAQCPEAAVVKLADRIANIEACERGDRHSARYVGEHPAFADAIAPLVDAAMWQRYLDALGAKTGA